MHPYLISKLMTERYSPKHRLVLADIRRQHKACSGTNNQCYPYLISKLMTERYSPNAQSISRTNNQHYPYLGQRIKHRLSISQ